MTADLQRRSSHEGPSPPFFRSVRFGLAVIVFFGFANLYALRVNLSVAIVCMVNHTWAEQQEDAGNLSSAAISADSCGNSSTTIKKEDGTFKWTKGTQGLILGAFFWGYIVMQIPGGLLAERFGGKTVFLVNMIFVGLCTLLCPLVADIHYGLLIALRIIMGLGEASSFPAMHNFWSKWAPPLERSKLVSFSYAGMHFGSVAGLSLSGVLCSSFGWQSIFYVFGSVCLIWCLLFWWLASNSPQGHRWISAVEQKYILSTLEGQVEENAARNMLISVPWRAIFTSLPFWAIVLAHFSANWGNYLLLTDLPTFMSQVLQFDIKSNGLLSAIPYILTCLVYNIGGFLADFLRSNGYLSTKWTRKIWMLIALVGESVFFIGAGYCNCDQRYLSFALIAVAQGVSGFQGSGFLVNHMDIAPQFAGTLYGISNTFGTIPGMVAPVIASAMTKHSTRAEWLSVFWLSAGILCVGTGFYTIFASGDLQEWAAVNTSSEHQSSDENSGGAHEENSVITHHGR